MLGSRYLADTATCLDETPQEVGYLYVSTRCVVSFATDLLTPATRGCEVIASLQTKAEGQCRSGETPNCNSVLALLRA